MSVNSSSASNSFYHLLSQCSNSTVTSTHMGFAVLAVRTIILLPLSALVLYLGHQRWRQQRSFKTTSHSDFLTYHTAAMELVWVLVNLCLFCSVSDFTEMTIVGIYISSVIFYGEVLFHLLTCVDRYLAVVHPIMYLRQRNARGLKIRNISVVCVWLLSFGFFSFGFLCPPAYAIVPFSCILVVSLIAMIFCSLSVLCVLIRPGPGERGGDKEQIDQSKQRAFHTIVVIIGVWTLWLGALLVLVALGTSPLLSDSVGCVLASSAGWFNLPSCVLLPLLYLHRAGRRSCCSYQSE